MKSRTSTSKKVAGKSCMISWSRTSEDDKYQSPQEAWIQNLVYASAAALSHHARRPYMQKIEGITPGYVKFVVS